jgi:FkbM family methyltransferase
MIRPGAKVIECGAHHAYDTIMLSRWVGNTGVVYACEPMRDNILVIERNLALNGIKNVRIVPKALGPRSGSVRFRMDTNSSPLGHHNERGVDVDMATIDELCEVDSFVPDLIKIDVEGYEADLLEGAARTLKHRPALHVEVHPHQIGNFNKTVEQLWDLIDYRNYELWHQPHDLAPVERISGPIHIPDRSHLYCIPHATIP